MWIFILERIFFCNWKRRSKEIDSKVNIYEHKIYVCDILLPNVLWWTFVVVVVDVVI